jgi:hypothetical protein
MKCVIAGTENGSGAGEGVYNEGDCGRLVLWVLVVQNIYDPVILSHIPPFSLISFLPDTTASPLKLVTMQLLASVLLFQAGVLAVSSAAQAPASPPQFSPAKQLRSDLSLRQSCDGQECADSCIPMDAMCCDITIGIYCEAGTTCTTRDTCCTDGLTCDTDVSTDGNCSSDETLCGSSNFLFRPSPRGQCGWACTDFW